jgi:NADP-dependent 3-hydroxy acid dehydrogenase YdfG
MEIRTEGRYIITGAGGGIAASIIDVFAEAGARLALADIDSGVVRDRARPVGAITIEADLTDPQAARAMVAEASSRLGGVDGLIHTTGGFAMAPASEVDLEHYQRLLDINLRTLVVTVGAVLPHLIEQRQGFLAGFSAGPGWHRSGGAGMSVYAAAKAAVATYLHAVQEEAGRHGISTVVVYPMGVVDTPGNRAAMPGDDRSGWIDPAEIGQALLFAATRSPRGRISDLPVFPPS